MLKLSVILSSLSSDFIKHFTFTNIYFLYIGIIFSQILVTAFHVIWSTGRMKGKTDVY